MIDPNTPLEVINNFNKNTLLEQLDIRITKLGEDFIEGTMPVDKRTLQPAGLLHGGASAALIESLGSIGSTLLVDMATHNIVGLEINANHVRGVRSGIVTGRAKIVHAGRKTHLWQVDIKNEEGKLVCTGRLTVIVVEKK
ncbi:MAG: 1,4-dihydroxy-2-naphthoyl-CoA hydrolase [Crocinitomix sp.]|jgi:1,4-dihydroxy-2-naphthoyl-CoA hydrolase